MAEAQEGRPGGGTRAAYVSTTTTKTIPIVAPLEVRICRDGVRVVIIRCPWCRCRHTHGWPIGHERPGHRVSHCTQNTPGYYIEAPA